MGLVQKAFSDIITFSRSSNATRIGPTGRMEYAPHNLALRSQEFDNASWTKANATVTANAATAPDGTVTADALIENTSTSAHYTSQGLTLTATTYTFSAYVKSKGATWIALQVYDGAARLSYFNIVTGTTGTNSSGNTSSITAVGNGWYRCTLTRTFATTTNDVAVYLASADGTANYTGDGTSGIYLWGAQLSVGPYPLDYTPTTTAAVYGPRFDYDPVTLAARGLLVEEQRTNLLTYSEQFDNAAWVKGGDGTGTQTITANAGTAPDGTTTADQVTLNRSNASTGYTFLVQPVTLASTAVHAASVYMKAATTGDIGKQVALWQFDGTIKNVALITLTADWQRYSPLTTSTLASGASREPLCIGYRTTSEGGGTQTGSVSFLVWGAQAELGSFSTSYIPTLASTVTRSADVASVNTLSPWYNATEGSLYGEFELRGLTGGLMQINDGTNNYADSIIFGEFATSNSYGLRVFVSTTAQADFSTTDPAIGSIQKFAGGVKANDFGFTKNGAAASTDTSGSVPSGATTMKIGRAWTGNSANMWVRRIAFYPRKLSSAELQALSA